MTKTRNPQ